MIKKAKIAKDNVVKFPTKLTDIEKEIDMARKIKKKLFNFNLVSTIAPIINR